MEKSSRKENEYTYDKEFEFLQIFTESFNHTSFQDKQCRYNSTKLRHLIGDADFPCISLKTFDKGINQLNDIFSYVSSRKGHNLNPVFQKISALNNTSLRTYVFYYRLFLCLNLGLYGKELYDKYSEDNNCESHRKKLNSLLCLELSDDSPMDIYTFNIRKFYMPPLFAPLFVGILGSLTKGKTSWNSFSKNVLAISNSFYNENHSEINKFLLERSDMDELYTYWLKLHFPDELFDLLSTFDTIIHTNDRILSYNLNILADELSKEMFMTRITQKTFLQHIEEKLTLYLNTPLINPITNEYKNLDLCEEYKKIAFECHIKEINLLKEWDSKQNISS